MRTGWWRAALGATGLALMGGACSGGGNNTAAPTTTVPVKAVHSAFCDDLSKYVTQLDTYGRIFDEPTLTVGDLKEQAGELEAAGTGVKASADQLAQAITAANAASEQEAAKSAAGTGPTVTATTTTVLKKKTAEQHIETIQKVEKELTETLQGVNTQTPVTEAVAEVHAAAFGVEQAYVSLFIDAGCLEQDQKAATTVSQYVVGLQQDLAALGHYKGPIDGIYGPDTVAAVKALQAANGLPQTGVVDPATEAALGKALEGKSTQGALNVAALQGALTSAGTYNGPINGKWTPETEQAVKAYQQAQELPPTGKIDPATLDALLNGGKEKPPATTTTTKAAATPTTAAATTTTTKAP